MVRAFHEDGWTHNPYADDDEDGKEDRSGQPADTLALYRYDKNEKEWKQTPSVVDKDEKNIKADTKHAALYAVFAPASEKPSGADPTFKLGDVYAFPNPATAGHNPNIHAEFGIADRWMSVFTIWQENWSTKQCSTARRPF